MTSIKSCTSFKARLRAFPSRCAFDMCLGIPMQVISVDGLAARCSAKGVERDVSLLLLQDQPVSAGECVLVHLGYAIQKVTAEEARLAWELYDQILAAEGANPDA